jgi:hypothetical protein
LPDRLFCVVCILKNDEGEARRVASYPDLTERTEAAKFALQLAFITITLEVTHVYFAAFLFTAF